MQYNQHKRRAGQYTSAVEAMPQLCPAEFVNVIKTKTARFARRDYPEKVGKYYWKRLFWSDSYFIATVSERSMSVVKEYINNQQG